MITPASHPSVFLLLCLPQSTSIQLYKRYSVLNPGPSTVQHTLVCANSRHYLYSHPYLLYLLGKPIYYQLVTASTWILLSRTVLGILVQDTHPLTSHIALVVTGDTNSNTSALIHYSASLSHRYFGTRFFPTCKKTLIYSVLPNGRHSIYKHFNKTVSRKNKI